MWPTQGVHESPEKKGGAAPDLKYILSSYIIMYKIQLEKKMIN